MEDYATTNPGGWEIVPTLKTLARLHEEDGNLDKASKALERLADLSEAPKDLRREADITVCQMLIRAKKYDPAKAFVRLAQPFAAGRSVPVQCKCNSCVARSRSRRPTARESSSRTRSPVPPTRRCAMAYNALGDLYREQKQTEDAFWAYLRVDVMYNGDANEHAKALYYLSELFKEKKFGDRVGDPERAKNYRDRLMDKRFADTEYQKMAGVKGE